jgi:hypothetical protein
MLLRSPRARIIFLIILVLLVPWLLYALWLADYNNQPTYDPPPPPQTIARTDLSYMNCDHAVTLVADPPAQPVENPGQETISAADAKGIADAALRRALNLPEGEDPDYVYGPVLLWATLSDGEERLVYARLWSEDPYFSDQETAIIYLDAASGAPLVLYTGLTGLDPVFGEECLLYSLDSMEVLTPQLMLNAMILWDVILLIAIGLGVLAVSIVRTLRSRSQPPDKPVP